MAQPKPIMSTESVLSWRPHNSPPRSGGWVWWHSADVMKPSNLNQICGKCNTQSWSTHRWAPPFQESDEQFEKQPLFSPSAHFMQWFSVALIVLHGRLTKSWSLPWKQSGRNAAMSHVRWHDGSWWPGPPQIGQRYFWKLNGHSRGDRVSVYIYVRRYTYLQFTLYICVHTYLTNSNYLYIIP